MNAALADERTSKERLSDYLNDLALNPRKLADYRRDPSGALANSPLTADERGVLLTANEGRVYHAVSGSGGGPMAPAVAIVAVFVVISNPQCR